ncbi:MAG: exodeoxyribonuclease VII large subunit [Lachnospiraceae bacterium]|jgi:exodeoxyribonuclease VII large subunit|nr:exodeoxyribonuclease VII large subunit [Lachnospiraceae bacterium]
MAGIYSVSQVNSYIKNMFVQDFALSRISVRGEVSNCKYHSSGHIYFTLKDKGGTLAAVMFAGQRRSGLRFQLQEGQQVVVTGAVDVYERDGKYQLYAKQIEPDGLGGLFERFLRLRDELEEMGMFAPEYKQPIPRYASRVGVVTAPTGAAIQDIRNIASRRNPYVQLILYPALVQGEEAAGSIAAGIRTLDAMELDVLIVGRGGGSIEDLWAFNEELVARAIFECRTPVISAVGHETDVTIADYVADLRAPTPSAAAELAVFDYRQFEERLLLYEQNLVRSMGRRMERLRYRMEQYRLRLHFQDPERQLRDRRQQLAKAEERLGQVMEERLREARHRLALISGRLHGLSPLKKICNGFGFVTHEDGRRLESVKEVRIGDPITVRISDGKLNARVTGREEGSTGE